MFLLCTFLQKYVRLGNNLKSKLEVYDVKKILFVALLICATLSQADYIMKYNMDGEFMKFYYKNTSTSKMLATQKMKSLRSIIKKRTLL